MVAPDPGRVATLDPALVATLGPALAAPGTWAALAFLALVLCNVLVNHRAYSYLFAFGIPLHELAHALAYALLTGRRPREVTWLERVPGGGFNGAVAIHRLRSPGVALAVALAPFLLWFPLAALAMAALVARLATWPWWALLLAGYAVVSLLACARPSTPDLRVVAATARAHPGTVVKEGLLLAGVVAGTILAGRALALPLAGALALFVAALLLVAILARLARPPAPRPAGRPARYAA